MAMVQAVQGIREAYTFDDVVAALNQVEPYDWATFLHQRIDAVAAQHLDALLRRLGLERIREAHAIGAAVVHHED